MGKKNVAVLGALILVLSSCGKDKTIDDWRAEKANQNAAKIQAVSGLYQGSLYSSRSSSQSGALSSGDSWLGGLSIEIQPDSVVQDNSDKTGSEIIARIQAKVNFIDQNQKKTSFVFSQAAFNSNGFFRASIPVDASTNLELSGTLASGRLSGHLEMQNHPADGGSFNLRIGGAIGEMSPSSAGTPRAADINLTKEYTGTAVYFDKKITSEPVKMRIQVHAVTPVAQFLNLISPEIPVTSTLAWDKGNPMAFEGKRYSESQSILSTLVSTNGATTQFNCTRPNARELAERKMVAGDDQWLCLYDNGRTGPYFSVLFLPVNTEAGE